MELKGEIMPAPANEVSRLYAVLEFVVKIILTIGINKSPPKKFFAEILRRELKNFNLQNARYVNSIPN